MTVSFETMRFANGNKREIEGVLVNELKAESSQTANLLTVIGGTALGGIFGAVSKADSGSLIGAGIGAGAGTGIAFLRKGQEVRIKADEKFEIELTKNVTLPVRGLLKNFTSLVVGKTALATIIKVRCEGESASGFFIFKSGSRFLVQS